jgi:hypothetical protein
MNEQLRTSEREDPTDAWDQSVQAGDIVDSDDDTEAHGGKIFVRAESHRVDAADRELQPAS